MTDGRFKQLGWTSALLVGLGVVAKILAFVRDLLIADQFGATRETDAWFLVFALWIQMGIGLIGMTSKTVIPPFLERTERDGELSGRKLMGGVTLATTLGLVSLSVVAWIFAPQFIGLFSAEFDAESTALAVRLLRLAIPALPLTALAGIFIALGQARGHFIVTQSSWLLLNLSLLLALVIGGNAYGISSLSIGASVGGGAMLVFLFGYTRFKGGLPTSSWADLPLGFKLLGLSVLLIALGHSGGFLMVVVTRYFYTLLPPGQFSCQGYALRVISTPLQLLMPAVLTTVLPVLAAAIARRDATESERLGNRALKMLLASLLPPLLFLVVLREPVIKLIYERGAFGPDDVALTAILLAALVPALLVAMVRNVVATIFYSHQSVVWPTVAGAVAVASYAVLAWFVWEPYGAVGLALAQAVADGISIVVLLVVGHHGLGLRWPGLPRWFGHLLLVCVPAVLVTAAVHRGAVALELAGVVGLFGEIAVAGILAGVVFLLSARIGGLSEVNELLRLVWGKVAGRLNRG